ncbi:hypothetical protein EVC30_076 [Rhizobium phage RHph_Y1_11]|nr:hypothetical protein EVC30_076 [Rhizobium phage RHph_Y1_11]
MKLLIKKKPVVEVKKRGRPPKGEKPMSGYERLKAHRQRQKQKPSSE